MKNSLKYAACFIGGAVFYQIGLIVFFGSAPEINRDVGDFAISASYLKFKLNDTCSFLEEKGCPCEPYVETSLTCKADLRQFIDVEDRKTALEQLYQSGASKTARPARAAQ